MDTHAVIAVRGGSSAKSRLADASKDSGTGALAVVAQSTMPLRFGTDSFRKHMESGSALGMKIETVSSPGFSIDVDCARDLDTMIGLGIGGRTGDLLQYWSTTA